VVGLERGLEHLGRLDPEPGEQLRVGPRHPGRRQAEPVAVGVFADRDEDLADGGLDPLQVDRALDLNAAKPATDQPGGDVIELNLIVRRVEIEQIVVAVGLGAAAVVQR
jgi:hypothetical protein